MGTSKIVNENLLMIEKIPPYGSKNIEKNSGGIAGEIQFGNKNLEFFNVTGKIIRAENGKKCFELLPGNRYCFERDNLLEYLESSAQEYKERMLHKYKEFSGKTTYKTVSMEGWHSKYSQIKKCDSKIFFDMYIKESTDRRCYLGSDNEVYKLVMAYILIPNYTDLLIEKSCIDNAEEYVFKLKFCPPEDMVAEMSKKYEEKVDEKQAKTLDELYESAKEKSGVSKKKKAYTLVYERNSDVAGYVKKRSNGICDLCENVAPFNNNKGFPYLEEHHVEPLAEGGEDTIYNTVALCPNCHRKMHIVKSLEDKEKLKVRLLAYAAMGK